LKRIIRVLAIAAVMAAIVLASVVPAFAAKPITAGKPVYDCFNGFTDELVTEGLSRGQASQFEKNNADIGAYCLRKIVI
jgi:hypothetical protein